MKIGIDIEEVARFKKIDLKSRFYRNIFTEDEIKYCMSKKDYYRHFAARFAAKEAVKKALDVRIPFNHIEIINSEDGSPHVKLRKKETHIQLSLSHSKTTAVAVCIATR